MSPSDIEPPAGDPNSDWMQVTVVAPPEVGHAVVEFLQQRFGFVDIAPTDWCVLEREQDFARVDYAPAPPITSNSYSFDWRDARRTS